LVCRGEDALCGGRGDPLPWWRSLLVETTSSWLRGLASAFVTELLWQVKWCSWERLGDRAILLCGMFQQCGVEVA
jgi:hypothetical protein